MKVPACILLVAGGSMALLACGSSESDGLVPNTPSSGGQGGEEEAGGTGGDQTPGNGGQDPNAGGQDPGTGGQDPSTGGTGGLGTGGTGVGGAGVGGTGVGGTGVGGKPPDGCESDLHCAEPTALCENNDCAACSSSGSDSSRFEDEDIPDGTQMKPGQVFTKRWKISNDGSSTWAGPCGYWLGHESGDKFGTSGTVAMGDLERTAPSGRKDWYVEMRAPSRGGTHRSTWKMMRDGTSFGTPVWAEIEVVDCTGDGDCMDPLYPICDVATGNCGECRTDADCHDPNKPTCRNGYCINTEACGEGDRPPEYVWPVPEKHSLCQGFGNPIAYQSCGFHTGIDVCGTDGMDLLSMADGKVVHVGYMWLNGATSGRGPYAIIVQHAPSFYSTYGHNSVALVELGDCVTAGQKIAEMGNLGYSGGPHIHFEVVDGTPFTGDWQTPFENACDYYVDPMDYVSY